MPRSTSPPGTLRGAGLPTALWPNWMRELHTCNDGGRLLTDADNLNGQALRAIALRHLNRDDEAQAQLSKALQLDPFHAWSRHLLSGALPDSGQIGRAH